MCDRTGKRPQKTETCHYQGALTYYHAGVSRGLAKMDYSGLYPSIMLTWLVASNKDTKYFSLKTLQFLLKYRKSIKKSPEWIRFDGGDRSPECLDADGRQHTAKILANSLYGLWNTRGLSYNDPFSGAAITAYGRGLTRHMINWLYENDFETRGSDTDAAVAQITNPEKYGIHLFEKGMSNYTPEEIIDNLQKMDNLFRETGDRLNATMPGVTAVEYEDLIPFMWVPPNLKDKTAGQTLVDKLNSIDCYEEVAPDHVDAGLSKNYIYFVAKRDGEGNLTGKFGQKCKGKFKKRGFSYIQQGFVIDCISKLFYEGEEATIRFAQETRDEIASGSFPIEKLQKTVLVAANWKEFPKYGFEVGSKPTIHYVWRGEVTGKRVIKKVFVPSDDINEPYTPEYYLAQFDEVMKELPIELPKEQLELIG
jgi:DNA polymerase elongation subunit (family B)